jgi:hypothetical protein
MASIHAIATWFNARRRVVAYALLGWVALIVVGAGRPPAANEWFVVPDLGSVLPAILGALAVIELVLIAYVRPNRYRARRVSRQGLSLLSLLFITTVVVLVALAIGPQEAPEEPILSELPTASTSQPEGTGVAGERSVDGQGRDIATLLLIFVIAGALLVRSARRTARSPSRQQSGSEEMHEADLGPAIDAATQQLRMGPEPRMAVMAAYAGLERALAKLGHDRHPADTPTEHLAKALAAVPTVAAPSVRLGHLYELARFSAEPITEDDRIRAAESLAEARRTLAASTSGTP